MKTIMRSSVPNKVLPQSSHAAGATLSEVLISLLVMSIGVVSLATLFPISVLRSLQATQLTSAANLRYNVEAFLGVNPQLYTIGAPWKAATTYSVGDLVTPTGCCSPSIVLYCTAVTGTNKSGTIEPTWNTNNGASTADLDVTWQTYRLQNYVVDPLGAWLVESNFRSTANGNYFGNNGTNPIQTLRAFPGVGGPSTSITTSDIAADAATLPDSWISQVESNQVSYTAGTFACTLGDLPYDLKPTTPITPPSYLPSRIVLFDITGKISHVRPISDITGTAPSQTITWPSERDDDADGVVDSSEDLNNNDKFDNYGPLPTGFVLGSARVETKERRYTWMLSVRRDGDSFQMEIVVFFRRPFSGKDEQVYPATFTAVTDLGYDEKYGVGNFDDDYDDPTVTDESDELGSVGSDDTPRNWVVVQYDATVGKPFVKKGGYVTDADNLRWYRILDVIESDTPANVMTKAGLNRTGTIYQPDQPAFGPNTQSILLRVENKIVQSGPQPPVDSNGVPTGPPNGRALLMRNIVDVYPIRTRVINESL